MSSPLPGTAHGRRARLWRCRPNEITQLVTMSADDIDFATAAPPNGPADNNKVTTGLPLVTTTRNPTGPGFDPTSWLRADRRRPPRAVDRRGDDPAAGGDRRLPWYQVLNPVSAGHRLRASSARPAALAGATRSRWRRARRRPRALAGGRRGQWPRCPPRRARHHRRCPRSPPSSRSRCTWRGRPPPPTANPIPTSTSSRSGWWSQDAAGMVGMARRAEFLHEDPSLLHWCADRSSRARSTAPPVLAPIGPGGTDALLVATADGTVHAYGADGKDLPGWPVQTAPDTGLPPGRRGVHVRRCHGDAPGGDRRRRWPSATWPTPRGHDLDVVATDLTGSVWAWNAEGQLLPGWPVRTNPAFSGPAVANTDNEVLRGIIGAPALGDLQGNGTLDVVAAAMDRHVYAWQPTGSRCRAGRWRWWTRARSSPSTRRTARSPSSPTPAATPARSSSTRRPSPNS